MKLYFWQNVISIHQSSFLKALSAEHEVHLMVADKISQSRVKEGWSIPDLGNVDITIAPDDETINRAVEDSTAYHIFSGIDAFPMVFKAFKLAVVKNCRISVMAEPYNWRGFKGILRWGKYLLLFQKYGKSINHFFTTGYQGIKCFNRSGLPVSKLHHWGYFTELNSVNKNIPQQLDSGKAKLLYVGRIDSNKNIISVLQNFKIYESFVEIFTIAGCGPLYNELKQIEKTNSKIKVLGRVDNSKIGSLMAAHDYLILPSLYDGWGAVVNEALSQGTRVLCSNACGASALLDGNLRGEAFSQKNRNTVIARWCKKGPVTKQERETIRQWAENNISGKAAAEYFIRILKGQYVQAPWLVN